MEDWEIEAPPTPEQLARDITEAIDGVRGEVESLRSELHEEISDALDRSSSVTYFKDELFGIGVNSNFIRLLSPVTWSLRIAVVLLVLILWRVW